MLVVNERDKEYRFGDSGPKYLMRGPNIDLGLVRLLPGESFPNHLHQRIEEDFFILEGEVEVLIDGKDSYKLGPGDLIRVAPEKSHYLKNTGSIPMRALFVKAPYDPKDKVDLPLD